MGSAKWKPSVRHLGSEQARPGSLLIAVLLIHRRFQETVQGPRNILTHCTCYTKGGPEVFPTTSLERSAPTKATASALIFPFTDLFLLSFATLCEKGFITNVFFPFRFVEDKADNKGIQTAY